MSNAALRREYITKFYNGNKIAYSCMILSAMLIASMNIYDSWLLQQFVDAVSGVEGSFGLGTISVLVALDVLLIVPIKALNYVSEPHFMKKALSQFKTFAFERLTRKSIASFKIEDTGVYLSAFSNDLATVEAGYLEKQYMLTFMVVWGSGSLILMLVYSPLLTLIAVALCVLPFLTSALAGKRLERAEKTVSEKNAGFTASLKDILSGFSVIKSFRAEGAAVDLLTKSSDASEEAKCRRRKLNVIISMTSGLASSIAQFGSFLVGAVLALSGFGITPGILIVFMNLTGAVISSVREMPGLLASRRAALGLVDKMASALESNVRDEGRDIPKSLKDGISVRDLSFGYEPGREVLHDISFTFAAGKSYAVVGASGSGKSTLLSLLMASRRDYAGEIRYDGAELRQVSSKSLYELVSMVEQDVFVFDASIRDNITMFRDFPEEDVERAIERSGLSPLIAGHGPDYRCGENGKNLSGGEKQRISIARSLLQSSSVLLADEVTASLDAKTAYQVTGDILKLEGITRIVVTHALTESLLRQYDGILVLKDGRIAESGSFEELMDKRGYFHALYTVSQ